MIRKAVTFAALLAAYLTCSTAAQAQASRTFVSGHGADSGSCAVAAPCRSFAYAITQTAAEGEIVVLDSAGYGAVTIDQSISVTNPGGVEAGVTATSGSDAVTINPSAAATITLRGLTLEGGGVGRNGIDVAATAPAGTTTALNIVDCVVKDFTNDGILLQPSIRNATVNVTVTDGLLLNNATNGLEVGSQSNGTINGAVYRSVFSGNGTGVQLHAGSQGGSDAFLLEASHLDINTSAAVRIGSPGDGVEMVASTATAPRGVGTGIFNSGYMYLFHGNVLDTVDNSGIIGWTDGTNVIRNALQGSALSKTTPQ